MVRVRFYSQCPVCRSERSYYWIHHSCGGDLYLDDDGMLNCDECDSYDYIFRWKFDCGRRSNNYHKGGFEYGNFQGFLACISFLAKLRNPPGNFIVDVIDVLYRHKDEINS